MKNGPRVKKMWELRGQQVDGAMEKMREVGFGSRAFSPWWVCHYDPIYSENPYNLISICKCNQALLWVLALMTTKLED